VKKNRTPPLRRRAFFCWRVWLALLLLLPTLGRADLIISQVYEGSNSDRYIEVANTGTSSVDLAGYKIGIWKKTRTTGDGTTDGMNPEYGPLSGSLAAGACRVFKNSSANNPSYANSVATANVAVNFDGNDAIALVSNADVILDLFGVGINNKDQNFSRKPSAKTASNFFNPADWTSSAFSVADGATAASGDYLGSYFFDASVPTLVADPITISDLSAILGTASASRSYTIAGTNLIQAVTVTVSTADLQISTNPSSGYASTLTFTPQGGGLSQVVYVRIVSSAKEGVVTGTISHLSGSATFGLVVSGRVISSASKAGLRPGMKYSVPSQGFVEKPSGEVVTIIQDTSGSISTLQGLIDTARVNQPDRFLLIRLRANTTYPILGAPLILGTRMSLSGFGTTLAAGLTTTAGSLVRISPGSTLVSIDRLTLEGAGKNLYGIEGAGVSRVNVDRVTVRETGLSGIFLQGLGSTVFNNEMTVTRCTVRGVVNAAGIHFQHATQGVVMESESFNNGTGILLENADHCLVVNNRLEYNATEGVCLQDSKSAKVASNLLLGNPIGVATRGASTTSSSAHFIFRNDIQSATIGISLGQSKDTPYGNNIAAGVSIPLSFSSGAVNRVIQVGSAISAPLQEYFFPPTALNWHTASVKNGQDRIDISTSATTLSEIQQAYNLARLSQPGRVTVLRLTAPIITGDQTLVLQGDTCIVLEGRINLSPGVTAFQASGTTSAPLGFISISGGTIDGQNTTGRSGMIFTNCSKVLVEGVNLVNFGSKATRVTGSDVILFAGCKDPCIVDSSTISGGAARGIWTKGITGSSLSGILFLDNVISEVNMDGIDFDTATSSSSAFYNLSQNNIRYGVFVEEGAKNVQVVGNTCSGNDIGINVYSYAVGATEQNTLVANVLSANRRGLRFGAADPEPSTGILTRNNFAFNNRIQNTTTLGAVDAQLDGVENYVSQNVLSANILDYGSLSSAVLLNSPSSAALGVDNAAHANVDFGSGYLDGNLLGQEGWSVYGTGSSGPITMRGGVVELGSGSNYQSVFKTISPYQFGDAASVYVRLDLQVQSASLTGSDFFFITRETDSLTGQPVGKNYFRLYVRAAGSGFQIGWNPHAETGATVNPAVPTYADTIFELNTDYQLVLRCDSTAARNNDDTFLFVNPLRADAVPILSRTTWVGNTDEFSASTSTGTNRVGGFLNLVLRQPANTPSISMKVKNIVVASAAKDVGLDWVSEVVPTSTIAGAFANNSSNGITTWQTGPGWTPTNPTGGAAATIIFNGILNGALTANNDSPGNFMLNALSNSISGAGSLTYSGGTFRFVSNANTNPTLTFANNALVQTISNNIQVDAELKVSQAGSTALNSILAGPISGVGGLSKSGNGTVLITRNDNTFDGVTTVGAGQLNVLNLGNAGSPSSLGRNSTISLGGGSATGTLRWESVASETSDKSIVLGGSTGGGTLDVRGTANILTLAGPINTGTNAGTRTFTLTGQGGTTVNGLISGNASLRVNGSAARTVTLANTDNSFGGPVTIDGNQSGVSYKVQVARIGNAGLNSPLGTNRTINIGTTNNAFNFLVWSNSVAETTDKTINLAGTVGPALIVNKGPVLLKFTAPVTATGVGVKTFYPDQDDANGVTEFAGEIPNSSGGTTALNKNGPGTLILSTANTFTGGFTLKGGTLELKHDQSLAAGNLLTFPTNGTGSGHVKVAYAGAGPNLGNLLVLTNASIDLGTNPNSQIRFGSATNWTNANIILTIANSSAGGQLYITNTNGVALNQIKSAENSNAIATLNSEGLLTFTNPAPANAKPVVTAAQAFSVSENVPFATTVGTVVATDADANSALSGWAIVSGNSGGVFAINSANGQITVVGALNYEGAASYAFGVTVSDGMETSAVETVMVSVTDVSEYSDFFGISSPTADDNGDGILNLMAYALGATSPSSVVVPPELNTADPTKLTITALIRINDPKVSVVGEYGLTLGNWETASPIAGVDSSNQAGAVAGVTQRQDFSVLRAPDPKKFLHLKATQSQ